MIKKRLLQLGSVLCVLALAVVLFYQPASASYSCTGGGDHGGADWDPATDCPSGIIAGMHTNIGTLTIASGETVTVQAYSGTTFGSVTISANTINITGTLTANGKGYPGGTSGGNGSGPGAGQGGGVNWGGGGGYGGAGGNGTNGSGGSTYGDSVGSESLGSGGGSSGSAAGGAGGGSIILKAGGTLTIDGIVTANGSVGGGLGAGGGSGGSVHLMADNFGGTGSITAIGGNGTTGAGNSGGGGGGRIALHFATGNTYSGTESVAAGTTGALGSAGTTTTAHDTAQYTCLLGGNHGSNDWDPTGSCSGLNIAGNHTGIGVFNVPLGATATVQGYDGTNFGTLSINAASATISGTITADGKGYPAAVNDTVNGSGPGGGWSAFNNGGGGGYGGIGGNIGTHTGTGGTYGSLFAPTDMGSGGGNAGNGGQLGPGGGAIKITTNGTLTVSGTVTANGGGADGSCNNSGGSGGSVYMIAGTLAGSGTVRANGGDGATGCGGAAGGGGRIALYSTATHTFNGSVSVVAGAAHNGTAGGTGTSLIIDSAANDLTIPSPNGTWNGSDGTFSFHNVAIDGSVTLAPSNATLMTFTVGGSLNVAAGVTVTTAGSYTTNTNGVGVFINVTGGNMTLSSGASISADGQGYAAAANDTVNGGGPGGGWSAFNNGGGGGYGGIGGNISGHSSGATYGSLLAPTDLGSGGGNAGNGGQLGPGGGAIKIAVSGTLTVSGTLSANGGGADGSCNNSGGSGGSVYVTAGTLAGSGSITANGGDGATGCGGAAGGGGRIALYSTATHTFNGSVSVAPGAPHNGTAAAAGTAFITDTTANDLTIPTANSIWYASDGTFSYHSITVSGNVTFQPVNATQLTIAATGTLTVNNNATMTLGGSYTTNTNGMGVTLNVTGNVTVSSGATLTATGQGYAGGNNTGGTGSGTGGGGNSSGGGYGGTGGGPAGGTTYGSATQPTDLGSGGGGSSGYTGAAGGGAIRLITQGTLTVNGSFTSNGAAGGGGCGDGGGSGGSIYITTTSLAGSGTLSVDGGEGATGCGGGAGGGGRMAIYYSVSNVWSGNTLTSALAAAPGVNHASTAPTNGTVVINPVGNPTISGTAQYRADCTTTLSSGTTLIGSQAVCFKASASDSLNPDTLTFQVEVEPNGTGFTNTPTITSSRSYAGTPLSFTVQYGSLSLASSYHWQARTTDSEGYASAWTPMGGSPDFVTPSNTPTRVGSKVVDTDTDFSTGTTANAQVNGSSSAAAVGLTPVLTGPSGDVYRRPLAIDNTANASALTNYQVSTTVDTASLIALGKMRSDCGDIRITDSDQTTLLNYWIESGCNTNATKVWVLVPSIPASSTKTIYLFYGNLGATAASSIKNTFQSHADDFAGTSLDTGIWSTANTDTNRTVTVNNGATLACTTSQNCDWWASNYLAPNIEAALPSGDWEARVKISSVTDVTGYHAGLFLMQDTQNVYTFGRMDFSSVNGQDIDKLVANTGTGQVFTNAITTVPVYFAIRKIGSTYTFLYSTDNVNWTVDYTTSSLGITPTKVVLPGKKWTTTQAYSVTYNNFYIRNYTSTEPSMSVGSEAGGYTTPGTWTSDGSSNALLLNENSAWGDGSANSIAFYSTLASLSANATVQFELRTASTAAGLASVPYVSLGTADGGTTFALRKSDLDAAGIAPLPYVQVRATFAVQSNVPTPLLDGFTFYFVPTVPSVHVTADTDTDFNLGTTNSLQVTGTSTPATLSLAPGAGPSGFIYKRPITVTNAGGTLTNYQLSVALDTASLISASKLKSDCSDLRFTDTDGTTLLSYWLESGCNTSSTQLWVKIPSIAASSSKTIYVYYDNSSATSASNGSNTFDFFDDFSSFNASVWTATGSASVSGGALTISNGSVYSNSTVASQPNEMVESSVHWTNFPGGSGFSGIETSNTQSIQGGNPGGSRTSFLMSDGTSNITAWMSSSGTGYNVASGTSQFTATAGTQYIIGDAMTSSQVTYYKNRTALTTYTGSWTAPFYMYLGYSHGSSSGTTAIAPIVVDWVLARQFAATPPAASIGSELPTLSSTGTWQSGSNANALTLSNINAWGDGINGSSVALFLSGTYVDPNSTIQVQIRSASTAAGLASASYITLGTLSEGISFIKTKSDLDSLGLLPLGFVQLQITLASSTTASPVFDQVSVYYAPMTHTLTYLAGANGTISGAASQTVIVGANGTAVTAVPNTGYHFASWSDSSIANPRTDTNVQADITVTANFAVDTFTLTYTAGAHGTITGATTQIINYGASGSTVTAVPDAGYGFSRWSDGSTANPRTDTNVKSDVSVTAAFVTTGYTVTFDSQGGSPVASITQAAGTTVTVPAGPTRTGYTFVAWNTAADGSGISYAPGDTFSMPIGGLTLYAQWKSTTTYTLTYTAGAHGSLSGNTTQTVAAGSDGTAVTAIPDKHYKFTDWSDGSTQNPRTDTNVQADVAVTAQFDRKHSQFIINGGSNSSGQQVDAAPGDTIVVDQGGQQTAFTVQQVGDDYAILALQTSQPDTFRIDVHQTVDKAHLAITLNGINQNAALLTFRNPPSTSPITRAVRQLPPAIKYTLPYFLFALLIADALLLLYQIRREIREARRLRTLADRERQIGELKKSFTMLVSHYLRTPLSVLKGGAELLSIKKDATSAETALQADIQSLSATIEQIISGSVAGIDTEPTMPRAGELNPPVPVWRQPALIIPALLVGILAFSFDYLVQHAGSFNLGQINVIIQIVVYASAVAALAVALRQLYVHRRTTEAARHVLAQEQRFDSERDAFIDQTASQLSGALDSIDAHSTALGTNPGAKFLSEGRDQLHKIVDKLTIARQLKGSSSANAPVTSQLSQVSAPALRAVQDTAAAKDVAVTAKGDTMIRVQSPALLSLVMQTVLDNAVGHSPEHEPVQIAATTTARKLTVSITDHGDGIPAEKRFALFQAFSRVESIEVFNREGMGFSLYLDRIIMFYLHGGIEIEPATPKGTRVLLTLPADPAE